MVHEVKADGSTLFSGICASGLTIEATHRHLGGRIYLAVSIFLSLLS